MRFLELKLNHFGKFNNQSISLKDGINLIYGGNEAGKSTIHTFIRGMLFGIEKTRGRAAKDDIYGKYQPWDTPGAYSGSLDLIVEDRAIRIYRSFDKNNKETTILDLDTGRELNGYRDNVYHDNMSGLLEGLTESGYRNTISIEQLKARTGQELADEVKNYITNLSLTKSNEVDVVKALGFLTTKRKELEASLPTDKILKLKEAILEGLEKEARMDELTERLQVLRVQEYTLLQTANANKTLQYSNPFTSDVEYENYLNKYPAYEEKYNSYESYLRQKEQQEEKLINIYGQTTKAKQENSKTVAAKLEELEQNKLKLSKLETEKTNRLLKIEEDNNSVKSKKYISLGVLFIGIILISLSIKGNVLLGLIGGIFLAGATLIYFVTNYNGNKLRDYFQKSISDVNNKIKETEARRLQILLSHNVSSETELKGKYEELLKLELESFHKTNQISEQEEIIQQISKQIQKIEDEILQYIRPLESFFKTMDGEYEVNRLSRGLIFQLREFIKQEIKILREARELALRQQEEFTIKREKIKWELKTLEGYEDELLHNQDTLKILEEKEISIRKELEAIQLAVNTINQLSVDIHDSFGRELNKIVSTLTKESTAGKYSDIKVDEKMDIKILSGHQYVTIDKLSVGTMDQLYFAIRIAVANLIYGENVMPLLLDDSFALYDDERTWSVLNYLSKRNGQVLIFTCHTREKEMLDQNHLSYNYIDLGNN
ncbi:MAG: hypothetical protein K0S61_2640 [Anaerocolumna sp.]|nr:hypothetical protein [Anaerocolumna sp.]